MTRRIRVSIWGLLIAGVLLILWNVCYVYSINDLQANQQRLQSSQLADLDRQLNQFSFIPRLLSDDIEIKQALINPSAPALQAANQRLQRTQQDSGLDVAFLLNQAGLTIASGNWNEPFSFVGISYSFRPYFQSAMSGKAATFFAVGATTGIPGYFIAQPVIDNETVMGVVVAKVALDVLVNAWSTLLYDSLVVDEFGVIILSTRKELLYATTAYLKPQQIAQLNKERRYTLGAQAVTIATDTSPHRATINTQPTPHHYLFRSELATEPWQLLSLVNAQFVTKQTFVLSASITSLFIIVFLLLRLYQQQRRLVIAEKRTSLELEEKVSQRTLELEQAQRRLISESNFAMLGRMSGAINHEINQPLASLRLNLASLRTMIEHNTKNSQEFEQIVIDSDRTTKRIGRVISSLRSLARSSESQFTQVDLSKILTDVADTIRRERPSISQCLVVHLPQESVRVLCDEILIQQALLNLLYNAFDAVLNNENPTVVLSVAPNESYSAPLVYLPGMKVSVTDNGRGVPENLQDTLFEPFTTTSHKKDGLGLGLTIARQIAVDHGGELTYKKVKNGSCFSLLIPTSVKLAE